MKLPKCCLLAFALLFTNLCLVSPQAQSETPLMGKNATLTGLVYVEYFYEQPNYGESPETDHIQGACLLKLDNADSKLNKVQLLLAKPLTCTQMVGRRVEVTGVLSEAITGHHHGDALLDVVTMKQLR